MELLQVAMQIEKKVALLEKARDRLKEYAENKARTTAIYEKQIAITMTLLKNGRSFEMDDDGMKVELKTSTASNAKDIAKGVCHQYSLDMLLAEALYKNCVVQIECIKAELNGYQSIFRHLDVGMK